MLTFTFGMVFLASFETHVHAWLDRYPWVTYVFLAVGALLMLALLSPWAFLRTYPYDYFLLSVFTLAWSFFVASLTTKTDKWILGLSVVAAPVRVGERLLGALALAIPTASLVEHDRHHLEVQIERAAQQTSDRLNGRGWSD